MLTASDDEQDLYHSIKSGASGYLLKDGSTYDQVAEAVRLGASGQSLITPSMATKLLDEFVANGGLPREEGTIGLFSSGRCEGPFDMHLYPIAHRNAPGDWSVFIATGAGTGPLIRLPSISPGTPLLNVATISDWPSPASSRFTRRLTQ